MFCSAAGKKNDGRSFTRTLNAVRTIVLSGRFSLLVENDFKKALIAYLEESHQSRAVGDFTNTLTVLMRDEQEAATRAIDAADLDESYRACLDARVEIMGYLLAVALCGAARRRGAVARSRGARRHPTRYAPLAASDGDAHAREACLAEQLIDSAGNLSFGTTIALDRARGLLIGRAPEEQRECDILRVRYVADAVGSSVSRTHALVRFDEGRGRWEILDLGSNGTAVAPPRRRRLDATELRARRLGGRPRGRRGALERRRHLLGAHALHRRRSRPERNGRRLPFRHAVGA